MDNFKSFAEVIATTVGVKRKEHIEHLRKNFVHCYEKGRKEKETNANGLADFADIAIAILRDEIEIQDKILAEFKTTILEADKVGDYTVDVKLDSRV